MKRKVSYFLWIFGFCLSPNVVPALAHADVTFAVIGPIIPYSELCKDFESAYPESIDGLGDQALGFLLTGEPVYTGIATLGPIAISISRPVNTKFTDGKGNACTYSDVTFVKLPNEEKYAHTWKCYSSSECRKAIEGREATLPAISERPKK